MAVRSTMKLTGLKELDRMMRKELPASVQRQTLLNSFRAAAKPMMQAAKDKVPKGGSGALAQSINLKTVPKRISGDRASMTLSPLSGDVHAWARYMSHYNRKVNVTRTGESGAGRIRHGHLVEFGFRHKQSGKFVPARPFMRPAFNENANQLAEDFRKRLQVRVYNAVAKARKGK